MIRTQIYLTEKEKAALSSLSVRSGKSLSELIREAVDDLISRYSQTKRGQVLDRAAGMWKDRENLPDFEKLRKDWDRGYA